MSSLGPIQYEKRSGSVFLGRDYNVDKAFSDTVALEIDTEIKNIINFQYDRAKEVLTKNLDLVKLIAQTLKDIETLTKEDIYELVESGKLAWWEKKQAKIKAEEIAAAKLAKKEAKAKLAAEKLAAEAELVKEDAEVKVEKDTETKEVEVSEKVEANDSKKE